MKRKKRTECLMMTTILKEKIDEIASGCGYCTNCEWRTSRPCVLPRCMKGGIIYRDRIRAEREKNWLSRYLESLRKEKRLKETLREVRSRADSDRAAGRWE